jgi:hypothetical protein
VTSPVARLKPDSSSSRCSGTRHGSALGMTCADYLTRLDFAVLDEFCRWPKPAVSCSST